MTFANALKLRGAAPAGHALLPMLCTHSVPQPERLPPLSAAHLQHVFNEDIFQLSVLLSALQVKRNQLPWSWQKLAAFAIACAMCNAVLHTFGWIPFPT